MNVKTHRQARHSLSKSTESNVQWPTPAGTERRVEVAVAARRRCPDRAGHDAPEHGFNTPTFARNAQRPHFIFPGLLLCPQQSRRAPAAPSSTAVAIAVRKLTTSRPIVTTAALLAPQRPTTSSRAR